MIRQWCAALHCRAPDISRQQIHLQHILIGQDDLPDCPVKQMLFWEEAVSPSQSVRQCSVLYRLQYNQHKKKNYFPDVQFDWPHQTLLEKLHCEGRVWSLPAKLRRIFERENCRMLISSYLSQCDSDCIKRSARTWNGPNASQVIEMAQGVPRLNNIYTSDIGFLRVYVVVVREWGREEWNFQPFLLAQTSNQATLDEVFQG